MQPFCGRTGQCRDIAYTTPERPTKSPTTSPSGWRFKEESGLTWTELNRRLGTHPYTMRRWVLGRARPSMRYMMVLLALAGELGLAHLFTD